MFANNKDVLLLMSLLQPSSLYSPSNTLCTHLPCKQQEQVISFPSLLDQSGLGRIGLCFPREYILQRRLPEQLLL